MAAFVQKKVSPLKIFVINGRFVLFFENIDSSKLSDNKFHDDSNNYCTAIVAHRSRSTDNNVVVKHGKGESGGGGGGGVGT